MIGSLQQNEDSDNVTSDAAEDSNSNVYELEVKVDELKEQIQELYIVQETGSDGKRTL